ncbi:VanZ family protein [Bacillus sp. NPDC094106]|uniref:VanZ family protein n=1 Tax=Bacillus sp. NPDC094106 TaxID=3363949 RepID=UPI0037F56168
MNYTKLMKNIVVPILFIIYMYLLIKVILFKLGPIELDFLWYQINSNLNNPINIMNQLQSGNFIPFKSISNNVQSLSYHDLINLFGNIIIFIPYGTFLLFFSKNKMISFKGVLILSLVLSLCFECLQIVFSIGSFDVDDLILNTSGGLLGYSAYKIYNNILKTRNQELNHSK